MATQNSINNASPNIAAHSIVISEGQSPQVGVLLAAGQVLLGVSGGDPVPTTLPVSTSFVDQITSSATIAANTSYLTNNGASLVTYTLPATMAKGSIFQITGTSTGGWTIAQGATQLIHFGSSTTTTGAVGTLSSTNAFDCVTIRCSVANTTFVVEQSVGNLGII